MLRISSIPERYVMHIGSTSIRWICAKPVIDVAVAVRSFEDIMKHNEELSDNGIVYRGQDIPGQHLYRSGDLDNDIVTHFIHVVIADSLAWHNYIDFKDYLNEHPEDAKAYECQKKNCVSDIRMTGNLMSNGRKRSSMIYWQKRESGMQGNTIKTGILTTGEYYE